MKAGTLLGALAWAFFTAAFGIGTVVALRTDATETRELRGTLTAVKAERHIPIIEEVTYPYVRKVNRGRKGTVLEAGKAVIVRKPHPDPAGHAHWISLRVSGDATLYATAEEWGGCEACDRFVKEVSPGTEVTLIVSELPHTRQSGARIVHGFSAGGKTYRGFIRADVVRPYALAVLGGLTLLFGLLFAGRIRNLLRQARG